MRIHIPCLEVRDQTRMPQGPHIVQPNHHPRFHGALPARIGSLLFVSSGSVSYQIGSSSLFDTFATRLIAQPLTIDLLGGLDFGCLSPCTFTTAMVLSLLDHAEQSAKRCSARKLML